jgi:hypothetical protein
MPVSAPMPNTSMRQPKSTKSRAMTSPVQASLHTTATLIVLKQRSRPRYLTGAPQSMQSRCRFPIGRNQFQNRPNLHRRHRPAPRVGCLRLRQNRPRRSEASGSNGVVSISNKSFGVHCNAVHDTISVESLIWPGSLVNSADTTPPTSAPRPSRPVDAAARFLSTPRARRPTTQRGSRGGPSEHVLTVGPQLANPIRAGRAVGDRGGQIGEHIPGRVNPRSW